MNDVIVLSNPLFNAILYNYSLYRRDIIVRLDNYWISCINTGLSRSYLIERLLLKIVMYVLVSLFLFLKRTSLAFHNEKLCHIMSYGSLWNLNACVSQILMISIIATYNWQVHNWRFALVVFYGHSSNQLL